MYRSNDGLTLLITSSDGFCSTLSFSEKELGDHYTGETPSARHPHVHSSSISSSQNTPIATPTTTHNSSSFPSHPASHLHHRNSSASAISMGTPLASSPPPTSTLASPVPPTHPNQIRPSSPTRSNSTSSVATQSSQFAPGASTIISNPTLVSGNLPGISAANPIMAGFLNSMPMTTPPETPRSTTSSVVGNKREAPEPDHDDADKPKPDESSGGEKKRRRIAPTTLGEAA